MSDFNAPGNAKFNLQEALETILRGDWLTDSRWQGEGVRVAILDTGISPEVLQKKHGANGTTLEPMECVVLREQEIVPSQGKASSPHGTVVADILLSHAPRARLFSADLFGSRAGSDLDLLLRGLRLAMDTWQCKVINISLGLSENKVLQPWRRLQLLQVLEEAYQRDILVFCPAHNDHPTIRSYPALFAPPLFSVNKGFLDDLLKFRYRPWQGVEFAGHGQASLAPEGTDPATSWATAQVAGMATRLVSAWPGIKPFEMKTLLYWISESLGKREK